MNCGVCRKPRVNAVEGDSPVDTLLHFGLGNAVMPAAMALVAALAGRVCRRPAVVHGLWLLVLIKLVTPSFLPVSIQKLLLPGEKADKPVVLDALAVSPAFEANTPSAGAQSI